MTARNHDTRTDVPWRERGIGMTADGALCSRCNVKRPLRGATRGVESASGCADD